MTFTETIGAVHVADPQRWLEDDADPTVLEWQCAANAKTVEDLSTSPHAPMVAEAVRSTFADVFTFAAPQRHGDTWFRLQPVPGRNSMALTVGDSATDTTRVLADSSDHGPDAAIAIWEPSHDGSKVIIGVDIGGGACAISVLATGDGSVLLDLGPQVGVMLFAWAADGSGFFHQKLATTAGPDGQVVPEPQIYWQPLNGEAERIKLAFDHPYTWPITSPDGRWLILTADQTGPRPRWITRLGSDQWTRFLPGSTAMFKGAIIGDEFWAITDDTSGWGRLVAVPLDTPNDESTWRDLVPATAEVKLTSVTRCGNYVALTTIEGGTMRLRTLDLSGESLHEVALPGDGAFGRTAIGHIGSIMTDVVGPDGDGCVFVHSTLTHGPSVLRADLAAGTVEILEPSSQAHDRVLTHHTVEGPHGPVDYWVLSCTGTVLDGSAPVVATGYGGFNCPWIPSYSPMGAALTSLGGVWVHAQLRGGGERDTAFWEAGRMTRKQGTFDDFFAVLEDLHRRGIATPERTGIWGSSNGGLLVGATLVQRPELIRAAVAQVPILDLMQSRRDPGSLAVAMADYGHPEDPVLGPVMHAYSPYHGVQDGTAYPALLCDAGAQDLSCPPWHSRKMVAAVQQASTSGHRALLRVREGAGHNSMTAQQFIERDTEELTFLLDELTP